MGEFGFGQSARKLLENKGKVLFYETYFQESNIIWKPLIWSTYKIITIFGPKKMGAFYFWQSISNINWKALIWVQR